MRPRLFLDIDGVINAPNPPWPSTTTFTISDHRGSGYVVNYPITVAPAMVAEIDQLRADFDLELVILSTWLENRAIITDLTTALGALRGGRLLTVPRPKLSGWRPPTWKRDALLGDLDREPGPFIWVDDQDVPVHGAFVKGALEVPSLLLASEPEHGITPGDVVAMRLFLEGL